MLRLQIAVPLLLYSLMFGRARAQGPSCPLPSGPHKSSRYNTMTAEDAKLRQYVERAAQVKGNINDSLPLVTEFLDSLSGTDESRDHATQVILQLLINPQLLGVNEPNWRRYEVLNRLSNLDGLLEDEDHTTIYLRGKTQHAIRISRTGTVEVLDTKAAQAEYQSYCRRDITRHSTTDMALFDVEPLSNGGREVFIAGQSIQLSAHEFSNLKMGVPLPQNHPLTAAMNSAGKAKVLYSNPKMQKQGPAMQAADDFAFALQRAYPDKPVYRDPLSEKTTDLVKHLNEFVVSGPDDIVAVVADDSFKPRPKDYSVIQDLKYELEQDGIRVETYRPGIKISSASGKGLIVITGHSSLEMAGFVRALGSSGVFRGSYVLFNSCETPLSRQLIMEINTRYGAVSTFAHQGAIAVQDLDPFLIDFGALVKSGKQGTFHDLITDSLHRRGLNGVWTVCSLLFKEAFG